MSIIKAKEKTKIHENIIGKIIYGFLLFAPLLMILTTSCYAIFNKNAFESYYGSTINESINVDVAYTELKNNNVYYLQPEAINTETSYTYFEVYIYEAKNMNTGTVYSGDTYNRIRVFKGTNTQIYTQIMRIDAGNSIIITSNITIQFTFNAPSQNGTITQFIDIWKVEHNKYSYLDNNFDYGIYKTEQSQYFNWSKNTALYTGLKTTCQSLGIENTFTPMLMAYWLLISIIYFIFDIGLIMVHIVHRKIHEFTESI